VLISDRLTRPRATDFSPSYNSTSYNLQLPSLPSIPLNPPHLHHIKIQPPSPPPPRAVLSREYEATQNTVGRHAHANPAEHEQRMAKAQADRVAGLKANSELAHALSRAQAELELLKHELADEEADAVEVGVLNSEV